MDSDDDVLFVKVSTVKSQKKASWVTSSFDDFEPTPTSQTFPSNCSSQLTKAQPFTHPQPRKMVQKKISGSLLREKSASVSEPPVSGSRKRPRELSLPAHKLLSVVKADGRRNKLKPTVNFDLWSDKYAPKKKEELAVHKKKVEDISCWLRDRTKSFPKHAAPILLLTGPPGTGKTATIKTVASELRLDIQEWTNPTTAGGDSDFMKLDQADWAERSSVDVYTSQSQSSQFSHFLLRANKYQALQLNLSHTTTDRTDGRLILVEDVPNAFYRDPSELHNILRRFRRYGHCPLVFVISDAANSSSNVQRLFPPSLQEELRVETISVNPVAPTMMVKVLNKIANTEATQGHFATPSARVVESIAMSSAGDVRSAINALQFACRQDTLDLSKLSAVQKTLKKENSGSGRRLKYGGLSKQDSGSGGYSQGEGVIGAKDTTCFLFHALGKILYFKRGEPSESSTHPELPSHLSQHDRDPLLMTPEEVVEKTHISGDYFNTFLHQNYVDFIQSVNDLDRASQYLSDADLLSAQYTSRGQLQDYSISVATRGFIHSESSICRHTDSRKGHGWRPFHKSQWFAAQRQCQESKASAMQLFRGYHWDPEVLLTEVVPYINLTNPTLHDPGQISFVQNLCQFSRSSYKFRSGLEKIEEKAAVDDDSIDSESQPVTPAPLSSLSSGVQQTTQPSSFTSSSVLPHTEGEESDDDNLPSSQSTVKTVPVDIEEDESVIEEFDD